jgi:Fungal Zn(2)-Cys(6) binuclear cluster domain
VRRYAKASSKRIYTAWYRPLAFPILARSLFVLRFANIAINSHHMDHISPQQHQTSTPRWRAACNRCHSQKVRCQKVNRSQSCSRCLEAGVLCSFGPRERRSARPAKQMREPGKQRLQLAQERDQGPDRDAPSKIADEHQRNEAGVRLSTDTRRQSFSLFVSCFDSVPLLSLYTLRYWI